MAVNRRGKTIPGKTTKVAAPRFTTLKLVVKDRIATLTLNRPERLNAINDAMPGEIRAAVEAANADDRVHVIVLLLRLTAMFVLDQQFIPPAGAPPAPS